MVDDSRNIKHVIKSCKTSSAAIVSTAHTLAHAQETTLAMVSVHSFDKPFCRWINPPLMTRLVLHRGEECCGKVEDTSGVESFRESEQSVFSI